ncbi:hypothetical protein SLG_21900 [Sphingobium sp. SYK-6]|uniref:hypothetical protein n=1 Tax=Sphingobium sp. (strain NBRC 103272 / SYK-6) TaxID=627192 RepID=UPI00022770B9|nr:hypothetical protein [Sphingobium sp. SYK-6]BAK66865.1 hypothetical protein SLG_21900 [Sphingobium sp. SYK-6]
MSLDRIIDARLRAHERNAKQQAGIEALLARNETIRRLKRQGVPDEDIARRYGIGITTVGKISVGNTGRR